MFHLLLSLVFSANVFTLCLLSHSRLSQLLLTIFFFDASCNYTGLLLGSAAGLALLWKGINWLKHKREVRIRQKIKLRGSYRFLGIEASTQTMKAVVIDETGAVIVSESVSFDKDLPEYKTDGGKLPSDDPLEALVPSLMFVDALEVLLDRLKKRGVDLSTVCFLSCFSLFYVFMFLNCLRSY